MVPFSLKNLEKIENFNIEIINSKENQFEIFSNIYKNYDSCFIFESLTGPKELAETSLIGFDPLILIRCDTKYFKVIDSKNKTIIINDKVTEPLHQLRLIFNKLVDSKKNIAPITYRYMGGAVGYVSYDAIRYWEKLPKPKKKILNFPLIELGLFTDGILYDHIKKNAYYFYTNDKQHSRFDEIDKIINEKNPGKTKKSIEFN
ncbi:MAG: hypothetical protein ACE5SW_10095, partial [Nitrososphaeraceae archaeon]